MTDESRASTATLESDRGPMIGPPQFPTGPTSGPIAEPGVGVQTDRTEHGGVTIHIPAIPYRRLAGFALVGFAGLLAMFLVYLAAFTPLTASRDQQRLADSLQNHPLTVYSLVGGRLPPEGGAVAVIKIPAIGVDQVVVAGTSAADLMSGPGLMPGSSLPGTPGNSVIAARRVTFGGPFGSIGSLRKGNQIHVVDGAGTFTYKVRSVSVVTVGHRDVVTPTSDDRITLVTSDSTFLTSGRSVVVATLVGHAVEVADQTVAVPDYELGLSGDPAAGGLAVLWSLLTVAVLVGAAFLVWRLRRPWLIYLFTAPVVMMCGLFACESVARALPATF